MRPLLRTRQIHDGVTSKRLRRFDQFLPYTNRYFSCSQIATTGLSAYMPGRFGTAWELGCWIPDENVRGLLHLSPQMPVLVLDFPCFPLTQPFFLCEMPSGLPGTHWWGLRDSVWTRSHRVFCGYDMLYIVFWLQYPVWSSFHLLCFTLFMSSFYLPVVTVSILFCS